jgi:hypothetical protein
LAVLRRVCDDEPRPLRAINPDVPEWLEAVVARLMAKDPARRFQRATEVSDLLARCLAHVQQPLVSPLPDGLEPRETPSALRRRLRPLGVVVAWATAAVATGAMAIFSPWLVRGLAPGARPTVSGPADTRHTSDSGPPGNDTDEVQRLFDRVQERASAIEADLLRRGDDPNPGTLSAWGDALLRRAGALGRDILSVRPALTDVTDAPPDHNDRR